MMHGTASHGRRNATGLAVINWQQPALVTRRSNQISQDSSVSDKLLRFLAQLERQLTYAIILATWCCLRCAHGVHMASVTSRSTNTDPRLATSVVRPQCIARHVFLHCTCTSDCASDRFKVVRLEIHNAHGPNRVCLSRRLLDVQGSFPSRVMRSGSSLARAARPCRLRPCR